MSDMGFGEKWACINERVTELGSTVFALILYSSLVSDAAAMAATCKIIMERSVYSACNPHDKKAPQLPSIWLRSLQA